MKIAIDIDDVLCETVKYFIRIIEMEGIIRKFDDFENYNFWEVCNIPKERAIGLCNKISPEESLGEIELVDGAREGIKQISKICEICFITSRPLRCKEHTINFLKKRFGILNPNVLFSSDFYNGENLKKSDICKKGGIELIIEDQELISLNCAENGIRVLLLDKPWNKNVNHKNIIRCENWEKIIEKLEGFNNSQLLKNIENKGVTRSSSLINEEKYFEELSREIEKEYKIANFARIKGLDPEVFVEAPVASTMSEKAVSLITTIYPEIPVKKIAERIIELEKKYGQLDTTVSFEIAREVAEEKFCGFKDKLAAIDCGIRIGFAYITLGVVASPIEGYTGINLGKTKEGRDYFIANFSGPIRSAGTTATCVALILIDYMREYFCYAKYDATEEEVKRYVTENFDYHERVNNLQYLPTEEEIVFLAKNMPIQISGEVTEKKEVSNFKDLARVPTNFIRGGMCLTFSEGLAQKAAKGFMRLQSAKKNGIVCTGWDFLEEYIEIHKKRQSGDKDVSASYIEDAMAGRPIYSYPSRSGGFRFRYGRGRTAGFSAVSIHPATMGITNDFLSNGTQLKLERPTKGCIITSCDTIEGPIVKLKNGSVKKVLSYKEGKEIYGEVEEIIYLGDILFPLGDVIDRNAELPKCGYVEEWWKLEVEEKGGKIENCFNISLEDAVEVSKKYSIALHPRYIFYWSQIKREDFDFLILWLKEGILREGQLFLKWDDESKKRFSKGKRALEILGVSHDVVNDKVIIGEHEVMKLFVNLGIEKERGIKEEVDKIISKISTGGKDVLEIVNFLSKFEIKDKAGSFIGARMGRPEKAKLRKLPGSPNVLFPVGKEGGRLHSIQEAVNVGSVNSKFPIFYCRCGNETIYPICEKCGEKTERGFFCRICGKANIINCEHGESFGFMNKNVNLKDFFEKAKELIREKGEIPIIKGIEKTISKNCDVENLAKGILRAKFNLSVNRDGTIRYDGTEIPITHFKPFEIKTSVGKLKEIGYEKDVFGNELFNENQILELKPHDIILSSCPESADEKADDAFLNIAKFIDDELENFYKLPKCYNLKTGEDLVGHLVVCMAPHNCAGVVGRIIGFNKMQGLLMSPYMHAAIRRDCDGDEAAVMLLMDVLLNFSRKFLSGHRGGTQDAPLVLNSRIRASEVDDQILKFELCKEYPLEVYRLAEKGGHSRDCIIETVQTRLKEGRSCFSGIWFTHNTNNINEGAMNGSYKKLPTMKDKVFGQMELVKKIRAVDADDVARLVLERHLLRDIRGNLRKFFRQEFRCTKCNEKFRRVPMSGVCTRCGGKLIFTINESGIKKYLGIADFLVKNFDVTEYTRSSLELTKFYIEELFGS